MLILLPQVVANDRAVSAVSPGTGGLMIGLSVLFLLAQVG